MNTCIRWAGVEAARARENTEMSVDELQLRADWQAGHHDVPVRGSYFSFLRRARRRR